ncbi:CRISPR-associated endonuclease Cas6 [Candidatus Neomarinimicrobiota bacterium]
MAVANAAVSAVCIRFQTDLPVELTPYQLKGAIIRQFPDHPIIPFINGQYRVSVRYPRIQVKVLRNQLCLFGLGEGYDNVMAFQEQLESFDVEDQHFTVKEREILESTLDYHEPSDEFIRYKFITPWVALDRKSLARFKSLLPRERINFLNRLLVQNLLFIVRDLQFDVSFNVSCRVRLQSLSPRVVEEQGSGSFKGYFTSNMEIPDYLGLGNGITKGLGTIVRL